MAHKCKVCGKNCYGDYCLQHKPRKALRRASIKKEIELEENSEIEQLKILYLEIWNERPHICGSCGKALGNEARTYHFEHLLEKSVYPELMFDKNNIMLCCLQCHALKTDGHPTTQHEIKIEQVKENYGI